MVELAKKEKDHQYQLITVRRKDDHSHVRRADLLLQPFVHIHGAAWQRERTVHGVVVPLCHFAVAVADDDAEATKAIDAVNAVDVDIVDEHRILALRGDGGGGFVRPSVRRTTRTRTRTRARARLGVVRTRRRPRAVRVALFHHLLLREDGREDGRRELEDDEDEERGDERDEMGDERGDEHGEQPRPEGRARRYQIGLRRLERDGFECEGECRGERRSECQGERGPTSGEGGAAGSGGLRQYATSFRRGSVNDRRRCQF